MNKEISLPKAFEIYKSINPNSKISFTEFKNSSAKANTAALDKFKNQYTGKDMTANRKWKTLSAFEKTQFLNTRLNILPFYSYGLLEEQPEVIPVRKNRPAINEPRIVKPKVVKPKVVKHKVVKSKVSKPKVVKPKDKGSLIARSNLAAFTKFRNDYKINHKKLSIEEVDEITIMLWNQMSNSQKCLWRNMVHKTLPSFCDEEDETKDEDMDMDEDIDTNLNVEQKKEILENAIEIEYSKAINYVYEKFGNPETFSLSNFDFFDEKVNGVWVRNNVKLNYWIMNVGIDKNGDYDTASIGNPVNEEFIIKRESYNKQLISKNDIGEYRTKLIRSLRNAIYNNKKDIVYWDSRLKEEEAKVRAKQNKVVVRKRKPKKVVSEKVFSIDGITYAKTKNDLKKAVREAKTFEEKIFLIKNIIVKLNIDIIDLGSKKKRVEDDFEEIEKIKLQVTLSTLNQAIFGAYLIYLDLKTNSEKKTNIDLSKFVKDTDLTYTNKKKEEVKKEIFIRDIRGEDYEADDSVNYLFDPSTVKKEHINTAFNYAYYGYFMYDWPEENKVEAESHNFNSYLPTPCAISSLLYNPKFMELAGFKDNSDYYYKFVMFQTASDISYFSNCYVTDQYFKVTKIKDIHNKMSKFFEIKFSVTYYKYSKKGERIVPESYEFPLKDDKKVKIGKKSLSDVPHFEVVLSDCHCFNINTDAALKFLKKYVLGKNIKENEEWKLKGDNLVCEANYNMGRIIYDHNYEKAKYNRNLYFKKMGAFFDPNHLEKMCGLSKDIVKSDFIDIVPKSDIKYKITGKDLIHKHDNILYASMDIETNPKLVEGREYHVPYSMSTALFNKERLMYEGYGFRTNSEIVFDKDYVKGIIPILQRKVTDFEMDHGEEVGPLLNRKVLGFMMYICGYDGDHETGTIEKLNEQLINEIMEDERYTEEQKNEQKIEQVEIIDELLNNVIKIVDKVYRDYSDYVLEDEYEFDTKLGGNNYGYNESLFSYLKKLLELIKNNQTIGYFDGHFNYNIAGLSEKEIMHHFEEMSRYCAEKHYSKVYCYFHYGGKFDMKVLEKYILKSGGLLYADKNDNIMVNGINTPYGLIHFQFKLKSSDTVFVVRDSYRLLDCPAADLCKQFGLSTQSVKYDYPYALYKKLDENSPKSFTKEEMIKFMGGSTSRELIKNKYHKYPMLKYPGYKRYAKINKEYNKVIWYYKNFNNEDELIQFQKFVEDYFKTNEIFHCEGYCRTYNDQDVKIVAEALIALNKMYEDIGRECDIKCLNPDMCGIVRRKANPFELKKILGTQNKQPARNKKEITYEKLCSELGIEPEKITKSVENVKLPAKEKVEDSNKPILVLDRVHSQICILHEMTLPSFVGKMIRQEGIYNNKGTVSYACTNDNGLLDLFNNILQGGICYTAKDISKRLFYSKYMERIATHKAFYLKPRYNNNGTNHKSYQELLDVYVKFGYDKNKAQPKFEKYKLDKYKKAMSTLFTESGVSTLVADMNSLYPSSISRFYLANGAYRDMTAEEFQNYTYDYLTNTDIKCEDCNNFPFIGEFKYTLGECKSIIPFVTKNKDGSYVNISDDGKEGTVILDHIKVCQFKRIYKDATLEFIRGVRAEGYNGNFAELIVKLYAKRQEFKALAHSEDENLRNKSKIENTIKLILNSAYGKMIQKEIHDNQVYLSNKHMTSGGSKTFYDKYMYDYSENITKNIFVQDSENITNIVECRKRERGHRNKSDWGSTILSGSKLIMQQFIEMIGEENVIYMDTDCCHCDASFALDPKVNNLLFQVNPKTGKKEENNKLGGCKSDFDNKFWDKTSLKPINEDIGLSSIMNSFCGKKMYVNHILGWHEDGYMTVAMKKRFKGVSGYNIHTIDYLRMLYLGEEYTQNISDFAKFKVKSNRGQGLENLKDQLKVVKAEFKIENLNKVQKEFSEILLK